METIRKGLGARIRQIRKQLGLNQKSLGEILGVGTSMVSAYESGDSVVPPESLVKIAEEGKTSLDWLLTGRNRTTSPEPVRPLSPDEKQAVQTAEAVLKVAHLEDRFRVSDVATGADYQRQPAAQLPLEEQRLLDYYRGASPEIRTAAMMMLEHSANESRRSEDGGSGSAGQRSA